MSPKGRLEASLALLVAALVAWGALGARGGRVAVDLASALPPVGASAALLAVHRYAQWRRIERVGDAARFMAWAIALGHAALVPMYLIARHAGPLRDVALLSADRALGIDVASLARAVRARPLLSQALDAAYGTTKLAGVAAFLLPALFGYARRSLEVTLAMGAATALSLGLFALVPAVGPWVHGGLAPDADQRACEQAIAALRSSAPVTLDLRDPAPIVAFPSWHGIMVMLFGYALWPLRLARWPALLLSLATVLSTLTTGWHYAVDLLGSAAVVVVSVLVARALVARAVSGGA